MWIFAGPFIAYAFFVAAVLQAGCVLTKVKPPTLAKAVLLVTLNTFWGASIYFLISLIVNLSTINPAVLTGTVLLVNAAASAWTYQFFIQDISFLTGLIIYVAQTCFVGMLIIVLWFFLLVPFVNSLPR